MNIERIVLATDFLDASRSPLEHAVALAVRFRARLYIFHAVDVRKGEAEPEGSAEDARIDAFYELAERRAKEELAALAPGGFAPPQPSISIVECVRIGDPVEGVCAFAEEKKADLIVTGTHGRVGLDRVLAGSVAEAVLRRAPCPVLTVRLDDSRALDAPGHVRVPSFKKLLVAIDHSESSRSALRFASELAARTGAELLALHVVDDYVFAQASPLVAPDMSGTIEGSFEQIGLSNLDRFVQETLGKSASVRKIVQTGRPAESIVRVATAENVDLLACGTHGRTGLRRAIFGSVAELLVRTLEIPVVTVREGEVAARLAA